MAYNDQEQPKTEILCLRAACAVDGDMVPHDLPEDQVYKAIMQRVIGLSYVRASIVRSPMGGEGYQVTKIGTIGGDMADEGQILRSFWNSFNASKPRLAGAKLRYYILPLLVQRAMIHGVSMVGFWKAPSKWEGYTQRYSSAWCCDLDEAVTINGAGAHLRFEDLVSGMGLPMAPVRLTNTEIAEKVALGDTHDIHNSCEWEAMSAFALYVRWMFVTGNSSIQNHDASLASLLTYAEQHAAERPHLAKYIEIWRASPRPAPMMIGTPKNAAA